MSDYAIYDRILIPAEQLDVRINALAGQVGAVLEASDDRLVLVLLEGGRMFGDRLLSRMTVPIEVEYLKISSYHGGTKSTGEVILDLPKPLCSKLRGKDIVIVDDIYDTGLTLDSIIAHIRECGPKSVKTCVLLEKKIVHQKKIAIDFLGFTIEDVFVIGFGMDYENQYRDLPFIASLHPDRIG